MCARPAKVVFDGKLGSVKSFLLTSSPHLVWIEGQESKHFVECQVWYGQCPKVQAWSSIDGTNVVEATCLSGLVGLGFEDKQCFV